jgi:hypothetical protein
MGYVVVVYSGLCVDSRILSFWYRLDTSLSIREIT